MKTFFWRLHQKEVFMIFVEENLKAKVIQKTFRASLGKSGQNPSHPKNLPVPTPVMKRHLRLRCPYFGRAEGETGP